MVRADVIIEEPIERLCGSGWLIVKGAYKRMGSVALIY